MRMLSHPMLGTAVIRDQKPINESALSEALSDMTVTDWYLELNSRVFFFLQKERLSGLLNARSYRKTENLVLTLDTASMVFAHGDAIELCAINSGFAQPHSKAKRSLDTFKSIEDYHHRSRLSPRTSAPWDVAELCVKGAVLDINDHILKVERVRQNDVLEVLNHNLTAK